jgi:cytidylate kinase
MSLVTISATYGAGGSVVGPKLAQRLGVPFVDRLIPTEVAERLSVPLADALAHDEACAGRFARVLASLAPTGLALGTHAPVSQGLTEHDFRSATEQVIFERTESERGVILGRAAAVVLRDAPRALHVRLDGPPEARLEQAMRIQSVDRATAQRRMEETDQARHAYVRHLYRTDAADPSHYHLLIDSTAVDLDACVEVIAAAATNRSREVAGAVGAAEG